MYILAIVLFSSFSIQFQLKMRAENMEAYSYARYDFKYKKYLRKGNGDNGDRRDDDEDQDD